MNRQQEMGARTSLCCADHILDRTNTQNMLENPLGILDIQRSTITSRRTQGPEPAAAFCAPFMVIFSSSHAKQQRQDASFWFEIGAI